MFKFIIKAALAGTVSLLTNFVAIAQVSNMGQVYQSFEVSTVTGFFAEIGIPTEVSQLGDGSSLIAARLAEGKTVLLGPVRCQSGNTQCYGLVMMAMGNASLLPSTNLAENLSIINQGNATFDFNKFILMVDAGKPISARYLIADHGYTKGNFFASLQLFVEATDGFFGALYELKNQPASFSSDAAKTDGFALSQQGSGAVLALEPGPSSDLAGVFASRSLLKFDHQGPAGISVLTENETFKALLKTKDFARDFSYSVEPQ